MTPVNRPLTQDYPDLAGLPHVRGRSSQSNHSAAKAAVMLPVGPALVVILLLSLGLWVESGSHFLAFFALTLISPEKAERDESWVYRRDF